MRLRSLLSTPGVACAALVGRDGLPLEAYGEEGEHLAAELAALRSALDRTSRRMGGGSVTRLSFTSERFEVVAVAAGDFTAGVGIKRGMDTRSALMELARVATQLAVQLPGARESA